MLQFYFIAGRDMSSGVVERFPADLKLIFEIYLIELNFKMTKNVLGLMSQICLIFNNVPFLMGH